MKRILFALACLGIQASVVVAQPAAVPAGPVAPLGAPVTVTNKCCSIWDFLGVSQFGNFVNNQICKTQVFTGMNTLLGPLGRALGLGPSLLSDKFALSDDPAMSLASKLKKEEKKVPLKVRAIKYLATLDCKCYPEIVDALLASLDDCSEKVRYEALKALHNRCDDKHCLHKIFNCDKGGPKCSSCGACDPCTNGDCPPCDCPGCMCEKKVLDRLNDLLLERDEFGCLKEKSPRIRSLATEMIEECLSKHEPPPSMQEEKIQPDPEPEVVPDPVSTPTSSTEEPKLDTKNFRTRQLLPRWFGGNKAAEEPTVTEPVIHEEIIDDSTELMPMEDDASHTVGYRGVSSTTETVTNAGSAAQMQVISSPKHSWSGKSVQRRHLFGELFGY